MAHYDEQFGTRDSFKFNSNWADQVWGGWTEKNGDTLRLAAGGRWRYVGPPVFKQSDFGVGTIEVGLVQVPGEEGPAPLSDDCGGSKPVDLSDPSTWPAPCAAPDLSGGGINYSCMPIQPEGLPPQPPPGNYPAVPPKPYDPDGLGCWPPLADLAGWIPNGAGCDDNGCGGSCYEINSAFAAQGQTVGITNWYYQWTEVVYNCPVCRYYERWCLYYSYVERILDFKDDDTVDISYKTHDVGPLIIGPPSARTFWLQRLIPDQCGSNSGSRVITPVETRCPPPPSSTRSIDNYIKQNPWVYDRSRETPNVFLIDKFTQKFPYGLEPDQPTLFNDETPEIGDIYDEDGLPWPGYPNTPYPQPAEDCCPVSPGRGGDTGNPGNGGGGPEGPDGNAPNFGGGSGGGPNNNKPAPSPGPGPGNPPPEIPDIPGIPDDWVPPDNFVPAEGLPNTPGMPAAPGWPGGSLPNDPVPGSAHGIGGVETFVGDPNDPEKRYFWTIKVPGTAIGPRPTYSCYDGSGGGEGGDNLTKGWSTTSVIATAIRVRTGFTWQKYACSSTDNPNSGARYFVVDVYMNGRWKPCKGSNKFLRSNGDGTNTLMSDDTRSMTKVSNFRTEYWYRYLPDAEVEITEKYETQASLSCRD